MASSETPSNDFIHAFELTRLHLVAMAASMVYVGDDGKRKQLLDEAMESAKRARGNRPESAVITWDDLRYRLLGSLRVCLEHLEGR